jgi:hypothetical protein
VYELITENRQLARSRFRNAPQRECPSLPALKEREGSGHLHIGFFLRKTAFSGATKRKQIVEPP